MIKQMKFQTKLVLTYSFFISVLIIILSISFDMYNSLLYQKNTENNISQLLVKTSEQLDNCIKEMDSIAMELISNRDVIDALSDLNLGIKKTPDDSDYIKYSNAILNTLIIKSMSQGEIYRASIFTKEGYFISNGSYDERNSSVIEKVKRLKWIQDARKMNGGKYLVPPHKDDWLSENTSEVFSLVRTVRDPINEIGFIEVQQSIERLKKICYIKSATPVDVIVIDTFGNLIYSSKNLSTPLIGFYKSLLGEKSSETLSISSPETNTPEIVSYYTSKYSGWTLYVVQNKKDLLAPLAFVKNITLFIGVGVIIVTLVFFYIFARHLTSPLRKLKIAMELINIDNLPDRVQVKHENNEIQALNKAFQSMRERLNTAIEHEIRSRSYQLKAQFDALQAQINPHFLYNILGVLANMGDEAGLDEISDTCVRLSNMLRYCTTTSKTKATLGEEIEHAANYLSLMKRRYEHRLEYSIDIDKEILNVLVPKLIIQPLIENSITHGFENTPVTMKIQVLGEKIEENWQVSIIDNGSGFSDEILTNIREQIEIYSHNLLTNQLPIELSIGGMGLKSTIARLMLLFGNELKFELNNNKCGGAIIRIAGPLTPQSVKEVSANV